MLTKDVFKIT